MEGGEAKEGDYCFHRERETETERQKETERGRIKKNTRDQRKRRGSLVRGQKTKCVLHNYEKNTTVYVELYPMLPFLDFLCIINQTSNLPDGTSWKNPDFWAVWSIEKPTTSFNKWILIWKISAWKRPEKSLLDSCVFSPQPHLNHSRDGKL